MRGIHKCPVMQKPLPFDDIIMRLIRPYNSCKLIVSGRSVRDFKNAIFNLVSLPGTFRYCYDNALEWVSRNLINGNSKLIQVMACWRQATNHYLSQRWLCRHMVSLGHNKLRHHFPSQPIQSHFHEYPRPNLENVSILSRVLLIMIHICFGKSAV